MLLFNQFCTEAFPKVPLNVVERWHNVIHTHLEPTALRPYHNIHHICDLLEKLAQHQQDVDPVPIKLAIWFHDLIYDARAKHGDNEENSAKLFLQFANEASIPLHADLVQDIANWIIETKRHTTSTYVSCTNHQREFYLFLDLDMSILAAPPQEYARYAKAVRHEYIHVPDSQFIAGRSAFLKHIANNPSALFRTLHLRESLLPNAMANIQFELTLLLT